MIPQKNPWKNPMAGAKIKLPEDRPLPRARVKIQVSINEALLQRMIEQKVWPSIVVKRLEREVRATERRRDRVARDRKYNRK